MRKTTAPPSATYPLVPRSLYAELKPNGHLKETSQRREDWKQWAADLWEQQRLKPRQVAEADRSFQRFHTATCTGCREALTEGGTVIVPGDHDRSDVGPGAE